MFGWVVPELFKKQSNFNKHLKGFVPHCILSYKTTTNIPSFKQLKLIITLCMQIILIPWLLAIFGSQICSITFMFIRVQTLICYCLRFPQHFPEKGLCCGQVDQAELEYAADTTSRRVVSWSALSSSPEQVQEAKGVNTQCIGWSGAHRLWIGCYCLSCWGR